MAVSDGLLSSMLNANAVLLADTKMYRQDTSDSAPSAPTQDPASTQSQSQSQPSQGEERNVEQLRHLVASLRVATDFAQQISNMLGPLCNLLASATLSDVQEALGLVITCRQFQASCA